MESCLRRDNNTAVSALPIAEPELLRLARRMTCATTAEFQQSHRAARESIAEIAREILG